jgi:hypothetical protein
MSWKAIWRKIMPFIQRLSTLTQTSALICMLAIAGITQVHAAKPPPTPLSCSISPDAGTTTTGTPITFTASTQGGKGGKSYSWDLSDGAGSPASSSANPVAVTYSTTGTFDVLLTVTDKSPDPANCSTTVAASHGERSEGW